MTLEELYENLKEEYHMKEYPYTDDTGRYDITTVKLCKHYVVVTAEDYCGFIIGSDFYGILGGEVIKKHYLDGQMDRITEDMTIEEVALYGGYE